MPPKDLVVLTNCRQQLAVVKDLKTVLEIRDRAAGIRSYLKAKNEARSAQIHAASIIALAEARAGQLMENMVRRGEARGHGGNRKSTSRPERLISFSELGIDHNQASRYQ